MYVLAVVTQHANRNRRIIVPPTVCLDVPYFFPHSLTNTTIFDKIKVIEHKMWGSFISTTFVWNISRSKKNWAIYHKNVHKGIDKGRMWVLQHCCLEAYCTLTRISSFIHLQRRCTHQPAWETSANEGRNYTWNLASNP